MAINFSALLKWAPVLLSLIDRQQFQEDPVRRGQLQNQIDALNFTNRFNPNFGANVGEGTGPRFNIGNPIGDVLSGFGGAFGFDEFDNPLTPAQGLIQNTVSRLGAPQNFSTQAIDALSALGNAAQPQFTSGITGQALDVGQRAGFPTAPTTQNVQGINPDFQALGIPQGGRPQPPPLPDLPEVGGVEGTIIDQLLTRLGIETGQPTQAAGQPGQTGQPGQPAQPLTDSQILQQRLQDLSESSGNIAAGLGIPGDFGTVSSDPLEGLFPHRQAAPVEGSFQAGVTSVPRTGNFQLHEGEQVVPAALNPLAGTAPQPIQGPRLDESAATLTQQPRIEGPLAPTAHPLSAPPQAPPAFQGPTGAEAIFQPLRNQIDAETAALLRERRNAAGALGNLGTGEFRGGQQDIRSNRLNALNDARLQAGQQFFGQNLAESEFGFDVFSQNRQFDLDLLGRQDELNLRNQQSIDSLFNLLLQLGFTADQIGNQGLDPSLTQQPQLPPVPAAVA